MDVTRHFDSKNLRIFWRFVNERHSIWHRRFVEKQPYPWTKNPILLRNKFTNIYRELDTGTRYMMETILERDAERADKVFNVMMYRLMCSIPTYDSMGFQFLEKFDEEQFRRMLESRYITGSPVFGNAYLISPYSSMGSDLKYENVARLFGLVHRDFAAFFRRLDTAPTFQAAYKVINSVYGFGPFLAYQVLVDLTYPIPKSYGKSAILPFSQNEWAKLGPGAMRGFGRVSDAYDQLAGLRWLWRHQHEQFSELNIQFPYWRDETGRETEISLANLQNCFCEFHKYMSIREGSGKAQRIYVPGSFESWSVKEELRDDAEGR